MVVPVGDPSSFGSAFGHHASTGGNSKTYERSFLVPKGDSK